MTHSRGVLPFPDAARAAESFSAACLHLRNGGVLAHPTETIYGLGGALDADAVDNVVTLKGREPGKTLLILISGLHMLNDLQLQLTNTAALLAGQYWPGALTLVLREGARKLPGALRRSDGGVAVRWTSHSALSALIERHGAPITSTSANRPGRPPLATADEIALEWSEDVERGRLLILDAGVLAPSPPSTVVDCTGAHPRVLRNGAISAATLRAVATDLIEAE